MLNYKDLYLGFYNIMSNQRGYSEDLVFISKQWTSVFKNFYSKMISPIPGELNPNLYIALQAFQGGLLTAMINRTVKEELEVLIQTLHYGICTGVNMTGVYLTTPPPTPLKLQHCFSYKLPIEAIANLLATTIFTWIQPTFSTQTSSGAVIKWM